MPKYDPELELELSPLEHASMLASEAKRCVNVYELPEYLGDGSFARRSDPRAPRVKLGSEDSTDDLAAVVRKFAKLPGAYLAEYREGGRVVETKVFIIKPHEGTLESVPSPSVAASAQPPQVASSAHSINGTTETIRATKELLKEFVPPPAPEKIDVQALVREITAAVVAEVKSAPPTNTKPEKSDIERMRELMALQRELREEVIQSNPAPARSDMDDDQRVAAYMFSKTGAMKELYRSFRDVMHTPEKMDEPESISDKLLSLARDAMPYIGPTLGPVAGQLIASRLAQFAAQPPAVTPNASTPAPIQQAAQANVVRPMPAPAAPHIAQPEAAPAFDVELTACINTMLGDMQKNAPVLESAEDFVDLLEEFAESEPQKVQGVEALLQQPPEAIAQMLATMHPPCAALIGTPDAVAWLGKLSIEIASRRSIDITELPIHSDTQAAAQSGAA
jgi:hypothetical protein